MKIFVMTFQTPTGHRNASLISLSFAVFIISLDIDECSLENDCHLDATCNNTKGSYNCTCKDGFEGDGRNNCTGKIHFKSIIIKSLKNENIHAKEEYLAVTFSFIC